MTFFTFGKTGLKPSSLMDHKLEFKNKNETAFVSREKKIIIQTDVPHMHLPCGKTGLKADIELTRNPNDESMNIATSWKENRKCFYLNEKVNCMPVSGTVSLGNDKITLEKQLLGCTGLGPGFLDKKEPLVLVKRERYSRREEIRL